MALTLAFTSASTMAQDDTAVEEFSGVYVGGSFGYKVNTAPPVGNAFAPRFYNGASTSSANTACTNDKDDKYYARVDFDKQFGKTEIRDSAFSTTPAAYTMTREPDWNAALRLRTGVVVAGGRTLFYATGGVETRLGRNFSIGLEYLLQPLQ